MIVFAVALLLTGFAFYVSRQRSADRAVNWVAVAASAIGVAALVLLVVGVGRGGRPETAPKVWFIAPLDGTKVANPITVHVAAQHLVPDAGHLHIIVDGPCVKPGETIPADATHIHLGNWKTEMTLGLDPGEHTLCLQAGNGSHVALSTTDQITVVVAAR